MRRTRMGWCLFDASRLVVVGVARVGGENTTTRSNEEIRERRDGVALTATVSARSVLAAARGAHGLGGVGDTCGAAARL